MLRTITSKPETQRSIYLVAELSHPDARQKCIFYFKSDDDRGSFWDYICRETTKTRLVYWYKMLQGINFSIPLVSHCSIQQLCPCRVKGYSCCSCREAGRDHPGSSLPPCSPRSSEDGGKERKLCCSFFPRGVSEAAKTDRGKGPERGLRYSLVVVAYPLSMYLLLRIAHVQSQWQPSKALTEATYLGWGEEEETTGHNVFIIHPRHKQQGINYQTVAHTSVAYTVYTGNCGFKKISRMIFLWLLVCLYGACCFVL